MSLPASGSGRLACMRVAIALAACLACVACVPEDELLPRRASTPPPTSPTSIATSTATAEYESETSDSSQWYDPAPVRASLRSEASAYADPSSNVPLYDLGLSLEAGGHAFVLDETVWFTEREGVSLDDLVLRLYANAPPSLAKRGVPIKFVEGGCEGRVRCLVTSPAPSVIEVKLEHPLPAHGRVRVRLKLTGVLAQIDSSRTNLMAQSLEGMQGMLGGGGDNGGGGDYGMLAVGDEITSLGGFYAVIARRRAGQWERQEQSLEGDLGPDAISNVRATVTLDPGMDVAVAGTIVDDATIAETNGPSRRRITVVAGMVREIAMAASHAFEVASADVGGVRVRSHYLVQERDAGKKVLDAATHALGDFERRFGPYPYKSLDIVEAALVGGAGGVEFSGLATVASMFYRPPGEGGLAAMMSMLGEGAGMPTNTDEMREFVVAHEVAHQWWHGLVGSDSRQYPFVDESLAQFSSVLYFEDRYGVDHGRRAGDQNVKANYQTMRLMGGADAPVDRPAASCSQTAYAGLVYGKGPYYYVQLRKLVGDAKFFEIVRDYVRRFRFGFAGPQDFTEVAAAHVGSSAERVRALAHRWLEETHGDEDLGKPNMGGLPGGLAGMGGDGAANAGKIQKMMKLLGPNAGLGSILGSFGGLGDAAKPSK